MARTGQADEAGRLHARVDVAGNGEASVATGVPVLDHLIGLVAQYGSFDIALEIAPGEAEAEIAAAGRALGQAFERSEERRVGKECRAVRTTDDTKDNKKTQQ